MNKPFFILAASAAATIGAMLLAIKLSIRPEEGPGDSEPDDPLPGEVSGEEEPHGFGLKIGLELNVESEDVPRQPEAVLMTESGMRLKSAPFEGEVYSGDGVSFEVTTFSETAIGFTISNTGAPLYYDPHIFPVLQYDLNGKWHELELNSFPIPRDLRVEQLPSEPTGMLLDAALYYTRISQPGHYRMVAEVYTTVDGFMKADPNDRLYFASEFTL